MNGMLDIAWKVFLFVMVVTCWKQITQIGISVLRMLADLIWQLFDNVHDGIEAFMQNRKGS